MPHRDPTRLKHMLDASKKAVAFTQNRKRSDLNSDEVLALAIIRLLEIIGEAAKAVSTELKVQYPKIPWRQIAGTRDRLIHGYFNVDMDIVWTIVTKDLPDLIQNLEKIPHTNNFQEEK
ncbi:MAG: DUF86 domain-containing protein [Anaerolineales bacterium]|nr:DUF86 domain-containing protein [Anaerolineales bacterium]